MTFNSNRPGATLVLFGLTAACIGLMIMIYTPGDGGRRGRDGEPNRVPDPPGGEKAQKTPVFEPEVLARSRHEVESQNDA